MGIVVVDCFYFILHVFALFYFSRSAQVDTEVLLKLIAWIFFYLIQLYFIEILHGGHLVQRSFVALHSAHHILH